MSAVRALKFPGYYHSVDRLYPNVVRVSDRVPDQFTFTAQSNVPLSTIVTSNFITVTGINSTTTITVSGGTYSQNGGAFTSSAGTANLGDTIQAQHTSSASYNTAVNTVVTIGGVVGTFTSTTTNGFPVLLSQISNILELFNSGNQTVNLSTHFSGATSYSISPAVSGGLSFNTSTGVLTIPTTTVNTLGPYTVTATNAQGSVSSNTFVVAIFSTITIQIANLGSPVTAILINPTTGLPYKIGNPDANSTLPIANLKSPLTAVLINPTTGLPY